MNEHEKPQIDFMHKLARQIVERRNLVFLFVVLATIFTVFAVKWVKVETDMTTYLPKTSETRLGLDIMEDQFTTYGSADVMVANIPRRGRRAFRSAHRAEGRPDAGLRRHHRPL